MTRRGEGRGDAADRAAVALLIAEGRIRVEGGEYVGTAADGVVVSLGTVGWEGALLRYLSAHPTPETW